MSLFSELKRRNVFRVATAYIIVGWLVTEILATLMPMFGVPDWVSKAVVIVVAVTFIPVLVFAWAFEMTPEGIKREKDVDRDTSITSQTGKKLDYVTIAAVLAGVAFLAFSKTSSNVTDTTFEVTETSGAPSVAVIPFVNMSGNAENEYFSDGLTETLLHMLAQVPELKVAARTSSFAFKGEHQDIRKIALALGVAHVLEGSVQRSGDKIRVTAQLIRAEDGFHVWSSNYDRTLDDIFVIQDEIAKDVGQSLTASLLGKAPLQIEGVSTDDLVAYDLYLQALSHRANGSYGSLTQAEQLLKEALLLDPAFYDAKSELAGIYMQQQSTGARKEDEAFAIAKDLFEQVLAEHPGDVPALARLAAIDAWIDERNGAYMAIIDVLPRLESYVAVSPNDVDLRMFYSMFLNMAGRVDEALLQLDEALMIDPVNSSIYYQIGTTRQRLEEWDAAKAALRRSLELKADQPNAHGKLAQIASATGDAVAAIEGMRNAMALDPRDQELPSGLGRYLYRLGLPEFADEYRDRALLIAPSSPGARHVALQGLLSTGDIDAADRLARSMVADDVDERHGSFFESVYVVLMNAIARENAAEGLEFIERHQPGFNEPSSSTISFKVRIAQVGAFAAWDKAFGREPASQMADEYWRVYLEGGNLASDYPETWMEVLALRGDTAAAIDFALTDVFDRPVSVVIWYREMFDAAHLSDVVADPRIQARMQQWDTDLVTVRADVQAYLEDIR